MSGANVTKLQLQTTPQMAETMEVVTITPDMALSLLESNKSNRPLNEGHVKRIARAIKAGKWCFNGDTIKISEAGELLDGQHRLWGIVEAKTPVTTIIVRGVKRDAFSTIDTLRKMRSGSDILSVSGIYNYRSIVAGALPWLVRWQRGVLADYKKPENKIENYDIEDAIRFHGGIVMAAERAAKLRSVINPSLLAFFYYVLVNRNGPLAERMMRSLEYPTPLSMDDPFFVLRARLMNRGNHESALHAFAWMIKAANAASVGASIKHLQWRTSGDRPEPFPTLKVEGGLP